MMPAPKGGEELKAELDELKAMGVNVLVSLLPGNESQMLGLEQQGELCRMNGIRLINFPIDDFNVPGDDEAAMRTVNEASDALGRNEKVVVHCRGGIGRSSLFTGALLVKEGMEAGKAFELVSKCRGCKVPETGAQESWLRKFENRLRAR